MKKLIALLLAVCLCGVLFAACGESTEPAKTGTETGTAVAKDLKIGLIMVGDESEGYTYAHMEGIKAAAKALGIADNQLVWAYKVEEDSSCSDKAIEMIGDGCTLIVSNSYGHQDYMYDVAKDYPNVNFVAMTGDYAAISGLTNFFNAFTGVYESRYVSGVVAGLKLQEMIDNNEILDANKDADGNIKIGYVGAFPYAEVVSGYTAFFLGIKSVVPNVVMEVEYTDSWFSIEKEAASAQSLMSKNCVIIGQHADSTGAPAAVEAAHKAGTYTNVYSVGYNVSMLDAAPTVALTSATNTWSVYYTELFSAFLNGKEIPQDWAKGYTADAVAITDLGTACAEGTAEKVAEVEAKIKDGSLKVFDTATFTVGGEKIEKADVDMSYYDFSTGTPQLVHQGETVNAIKTENGVSFFDESTFRAAPYFSLRIDGITEPQQ